MKPFLVRTLRWLAVILILSQSATVAARSQRDTIGIGLRMRFSENLGQWESRVLFRSQMHRATLFVERDCFTFVVQHADNANLHHPAVSGKGSSRYRQHAYRLWFEGSNAAMVEGQEREPGVENYYLGRDPSRHVAGVGCYQTVVYHDLYSGVDLKVYTATNAMKYDFIVNPGANPADIAMRYEGVESVRLKQGNIVVGTSVGELVELRPYAYQFIDGKQTEVAAAYTLADGRITFAIGRYDATRPLIIDPYLHFSTYTGSTADNWGTTGCYDAYKNTYTAGVVFGAGYPVSLGAYDGTYNGNCDIGIFKFDSSGSQRLYATYLGGSQADMPHSMFVNSFDELVIFGTTGSSNFPVTPTAFDTSFNGGTALQYEGSSTINFPNGSDIFICRFNSDGTQLQASTYVGGNGNDGLNYRNAFDYNTIMLGNDSLYYNYGDGARGELITDDMNNIYVGSTTTSTNFPVTADCIQPTNGGRQDGIVFKIDYNLTNLMWSTYLGGSKDDAIYSIDCDTRYNVVVCGGTNSLNFPVTPQAHMGTYGGGSADGFVAKISYYGNTLMGSTYFGSSSYDQSYFVRCGKQNDIFLFGQTKALGSTLIHNANYNTPNSGQFLARFKPTLDTLVWSTVFGDGSGEPNISPTAFAVDICSRLYLSGWGRIFLGRSFNGTTYAWNTHGTSNLSVTPDALQSTTDGQDFYIMSIDIDANSLVYATFFGEQHNAANYYSGGDHVDGGTSRFDRHGTLYQSVCASCSGGDAFPITAGAYGQHNNSSNCNNAVFRINLADDFPVAEFPLPATVCLDGNSVALTSTGRGDSFVWRIDDDTTYATLMGQTIHHTFTTPGLHRITLIAYRPGSCANTDSVSHNIMVVGNGSYSLDTLETCPGIPLQIGLTPAPRCQYRWITGTVSDSTIANPFVTQSGTYTLVVSPLDGSCRDTLIQHVRVGEADATIIGDSVTCSSPATVNVSTPGSNVRYQWSSSATFADTLNANMHSGTYSFHPDTAQWLYLHVVDDLGCEKSDSIHVRYRPVVDSIHVVQPLCPSDCDGGAKIVVNAANATLPYLYNFGDGWQSADSIGGLCEGDHIAMFRDGRGCSLTSQYTIVNPVPPQVAAAVEHIHCHESCTGSITLSVSGPGSYTLLWLDDSSTASTRTGLCAGTYIVQISDANGCQLFDTVTVLENVDINLTVSYGHNSCEGQCSGQASAEVSGGAAPYEYLWSSGETGATAEALCSGTAVVVVTDATGCEVRDSITIHSQESFAGVHAWADDAVVFSGHSTTLHVTTIPGGSYYWMPSELVDDPSSPTPAATLDDTTTFVVAVVDSIGCTHFDSVTVACISVVCGKPNIHIPNAFTPNNDGRNDRLCISGQWVDDFEIAIFTRWGEKVFESRDMRECWDGLFRGNPCMPGVYVYHCRIRCQDGQEAQFKGDITLIR